MGQQYPPGPGPAGPQGTVLGASGASPYTQYLGVLSSPRTSRPARRRQPAKPWTQTMVALFGTWAFNIILISIVVGIARAHGEWANGAIIASLVCLCLCLISLAVLVVRTIRGRAGLKFILLGAMAVLLFEALGGVGISLVRPLHLAQAHTFEARHIWNRAISEYQLGGETGPSSRDPARAYDEWGEALDSQGDYTDAISAFYTVLSHYSQAQTEAQRAAQGLLEAATRWFSTNPTTPSYATVIPILARFRHNSYCDSACSVAMGAIEVQARFSYGTVLSSHNTAADDLVAIQQFEAIIGDFPSSSLVSRAHTAAARSYYQLGQLEIASNCPAAVLAYQILVVRYADTPQAVQAQVLLDAPVTVTGSLILSTGSPQSAEVYLSRTVTPIEGSSNPGDISYSDDYQTAPDASGDFSFTDVQPGQYNFSASINNGPQVYWYGQNPSDYYGVTVSPICLADIGSYSYQGS